MLYKKRTYEILEKAEDGDIPSRIWDIFITTLIFVNVLAVIIETVQSVSDRHSIFFRRFELISVIIFTIEYILRIWSITASIGYKRPLLDRLKFAFKFLTLIDLLAIMPFYLPTIIPCDLRFLRALRLFRIFRILKIGRYSESMKTIGKVLYSKKEELMITAFVVGILLIIASSLMYYVENTAQPEIFSSIPSAMWWGVATLTTVGYGDIFPVTVLGKILGAFIALLGIGLFALPAGILASGFSDELKRVKKKNESP